MGGPGRDLPSAKYRLCALDVGGPLSLLAEGNFPPSRPTCPPPSLSPLKKSQVVSCPRSSKATLRARYMATEIFILML